MSDSSNPPTPKRAHKFRNAVLSIGALLLALVLLHWCWRHYEYSRFMASVRNIEAAGEPVLPGDLKEALDDVANPVPKWRQAAAELGAQTDDLAHDLSWDDLEFPLTGAQADQVRKIVAINGKSLADAQIAALLTGEPRWDLRLTSPLVNIPQPDWNEQRRLATVLYAAALDAHQRGDDRESIERIGQLLSQQRAMFHQFGIVGHLVAIGIGAMADDAIRKIGPRLSIGDSAGSASPQQVRRLIAELLDDNPQRQGQRQALQGERMLQADSVLAIDNGTLGLGEMSRRAHPVLGYLVSPTAFGDGVILLYRTTQVLRVSQAPDWPACAAQLRALHLDQLRGDLRHILLGELSPPFDRALEQDYRLMTENRLSAVLLASWLFALEHKGHDPGSLNELTPNDLPAVPADLMASSRPLGYRPGADPIVYSVGEDGVDDGGSEKPTRPGAGHDLWTMKDAVVHLKPQPRQSPPPP